LVSKVGEDLLGALGVAKADQDRQLHGPCPRDEQVRGIQPPAQQLGGPECGQRIGVPAASKLQPPRV
jgi:hypothetical protein